MGGDKVYAGYRITAAAGKKYKTNHYNLQAIIAVGLKVTMTVQRGSANGQGRL